MRWATLIVAWLQVCGHATGQVYFDHLYDGGVFDSSTEGVWGGIVSSDTDYVFVSFSRDILSPQSRLFAGRIGIEGETIETTITGDTFQFYRPTGLCADSIGYYCVSTYSETGTALIGQKIGLTKLTTGLAHDWTMAYGSTSRSEYAVDIVRCHGGLLLLSQSSDSLQTTADMHVIKVGFDGEFQWDGFYGGSLYEGINSAIETPDHGFLILGWTRSFGAGQRDWYLVKTDSLGNQEWQKTYGGGGTEDGASIAACSDGNYVMSGGYDVASYMGRIIKITPEGTQIWAKNYAHPSGTGGSYLFKIITLPNGDLVAAGGCTNTSEGDFGWLIRTDADGNLKWQHKYNKNELTDLFYSVLPTDDGGFLLSGQAMNLETNSQDAWLLKVDSVGCPYPNCLVGVDETEKSKVVVDVWPNPASESLRFQVQSSRVENLTITATDMQGRTVLNYEPQTLNIEIPVSDWPNGLYIFTITNGQERARVRVVVQH